LIVGCVYVRNSLISLYLIWFVGTLEDGLVLIMLDCAILMDQYAHLVISYLYEILESEFLFRFELYNLNSR